MAIDHEFIERYARKAAETARAIERATADERPELERRLRWTLVRLEGIIEAHLEKEDRVYLPLIEEHMAAGEQALVLDGLRAGGCGCGGEAPVHGETVLDVRRLPPPKRHPLIFATFDALEEGNSFILVNDHDPKPLHYQFRAEFPGRCEWEYLEQGPETFRVRIGKPKAAG